MNGSHGHPMTACNRTDRSSRPLCSGVTMLELVVAVVILGIIAAVALPRLSGSALDAKKNACYVNKRDVEVQAELWYRNHGSWPAADLGDVGADTGYFPDGLPACPVNGAPYTLDSATHRVVNHDHP